MSETLASFDKGSDNMPGGFEKLDRIEVYKKTDGSEGLRGIVTLGSGEDLKEQPIILKSEPEEIWGFDPQDWQRYKADPERWDINQRILALEEEVHRLNSKNAELEAEITKLNQASSSPPESVPAHSLEPAPEVPVELISEPRPEDDRGFAGFKVGEKVAIRRSDGRLDYGYEVAGFLEDQNKIMVKNHAGIIRLPVDSERLLKEGDPAWASETSETGDTEVNPSRSVIRRGWNRTAGQIGSVVLGAQARLHNGYYNRLDRADDIPSAPEVIYDGYTEREIVTGEQAAGVAAASALIGGLVAYLIWGRHGASPPEIINHYQQHKVYVPTGGNHIDYLKPNGSSAVGLPQKLHVANDFSGHEVIKNSLGQTVVSHREAPNGFQDRQGNLSRAVRSLLRAKGYILTQTHVPKNGRYMTAVWNR